MFKHLRRRTAAGLMAIAVVISNVIMPVGSAFADSKPILDTPTGGKITICHRTNSVTNPYVQITIDTDAADGISGNSGGHGDHYSEHQGPVFDVNATYPTPHNGDQWGDIIPPVVLPGSPDYNTPGANTAGLNWTATGQAIYYNGCNVPAEDATANVTVTTPTCNSASVASIANLKNATLTSNGGVLDQTVGTHTATFTSTQGHVFSNGTTTLSVTYTIAPQLSGENCIVKDATANVTVTPATCQANGTAGIDLANTAHATLTSNGGALDQTVGTHTATFTSTSGHAFANGNTTLNVTYTIAPKLTGEQCAGPKPSDDRQYRDKSVTVCLPTGGGTVTSWTEERTRTYVLVGSTWVPGSWSAWKLVPGSVKTTPATDDQCPGPKQTQPTCDTDGSLTLPAIHSDHEGISYSYVVTINGGLPTTYAANQQVVIGNIPQGATVKVKIVKQAGEFKHVISEKTYTFDYVICPVTPVKPTVYNDECYIDRDGIYIASTDHVTYYVNGKEASGWVPYTGTPLVVTAVAADGYVIAEGATASWTFDSTTFTNKQCVTITKSAVVANDTNKNGVIDAGDTITWTITVTNNSDNEMDNFYVTVDDPNATLENNGLIGSLASGESTTLTATSTITRDQMLICKATNTASFNAWRINREDFSDRSVQSESEVAPLATGSADATYTWTCGGKGGETPTPTPTTPVATQLPETGPQSSVNYLLFGLVAAVTIYGAIYFAQPKKIYE